MSKSLEGLFGMAILRLDEPDEFIDGVAIPEPARQLKLQGTVMHSGSGRTDIHGILHPTELKPGDKVMFGRHLGISVFFEGKTYYQIAEKNIYCRRASPQELNENLTWADPSLSTPYEYRNIRDKVIFVDPMCEHSLPQKYMESGWEIAAWATLAEPEADGHVTEQVIWIKRDVYKYAPKIKELAEQFWNDPKLYEDPLENVVQKSTTVSQLVKELADWAADNDDKTWTDDVDEEIKEIQTSFQTGPGFTAADAGLSKTKKALPTQAEFEYKHRQFRAYYAEPSSPEWQQLAKLKKEGWEPEEYVDNGQILEVTTFKRARR